MMVAWAASGDRVFGFGAHGSVELDAEGWRPGGGGVAPPGDVDAAVSGTVEALRLPAGEAFRVGDDRRPLHEGDLTDGRHHVVVDSTPETHVSFDGPATVDSAEPQWIRFPGTRRVTVGFCESPPRPIVTVPATPEGLATAVSAAGRTHRTDGPERSHPGFRPPTPRIEFGTTSVPAALCEDSGAGEDGEAGGPGGAGAGTGGPTMTVPESAQAVLVAAPLAYYLGAELRVGSGRPTIRGDGLDHAFESLPSFAGGVAEALRGLCHLDGRLRSVPGETGPTIEGVEHLESAPPARRLAAALDDPPETLPQWPLTTYVDDDATTGRFLPYLLDRLSLVSPARASALDPRGLLKRSLDEFFRGEAPNVEAVDPSLTDSRSHAWLGEGTPVDAYTLLRPESPTPRGDDAMRIDVVCNEPEMATERSVADVYRRRLADGDVDVRIHEELSTADLAGVFQRSTDLVHFVGHCEVDGMVCRDGTLAAGDLEECAARSFFLNACGSYYEGYDLVRRGAAVGAVTLSAVLDEQAVTLGTAFAELLAAGFAFDAALSLARGEIIVGRDYVVVGDGTHRLRTPVGTPGSAVLEEGDGEFTLRYEARAPDGAGRRYVDPFDGSEHLCGDPSVTAVDRDSIADRLGRASVPVRYDGTLHWSDDLATRFR